MQITKSKIQYLFTLIFILVGALMWMLSCADVATAGSYTDSGHGNNSYGVNRSDTGYAIGDCAHCHDPMSPNACGNERMLCAPINPTSQTDNFCLQCHKGDGSVQISGITNNNYSATFGGGPATFTNIYDAFNPGSGGSSHSLEDIKSFALGTTRQTATGELWSLNNTLNPCDACHNPRIAQKNNDSPYDPTKSAISRPSDHDNLWGDDPTERMDTYNYQAPYWSSSINYEPANDSTQDGSNLPDYATFCTDCHNATNTIYSTTLGRNLKTIDWDNEKHGKGDADGYIKVDSPYSSTLGKVLSCLDCHEPHGSPNVTLIRKEVNGAVLDDPITTITSTDCTAQYTDNNDEMKYLCTRCHNDDFKGIHHSPSNNDASYRAAMMNCSNCHESGGGMGGGGGGGMDEEPINCNCCHYHGSSVDDCDYSPYTRRTF